MKLIEMSDYNRAAKTYWVVMVCAGAAVFVWALQRCSSLSAVQWAEFAGFLGLVIFAGSNPIRIPNTKSSFTAGDVFTFLSVLFLGVPAAVLIGITDSFVSSRRTSKRSASWIGAPAMMAVTAADPPSGITPPRQSGKHLSRSAAFTLCQFLGRLQNVILNIQRCSHTSDAIASAHQCQGLK